MMESEQHKKFEVSVEKVSDAKDFYSIQGLEKARKELELLEKRWENYDGNNPNKFRSQIDDARMIVRLIEGRLKNEGVLERTEKEKLDFELDTLYPNAKSKTIVEYGGKKYQIKYYPLDMSRSGKMVHEWGHEWIVVQEKQ